jgi:hypothetical protein
MKIGELRGGDGIGAMQATGFSLPPCGGNSGIPLDAISKIAVGREKVVLPDRIELSTSPLLMEPARAAKTLLLLVIF